MSDKNIIAKQSALTARRGEKSTVENSAVVKDVPTLLPQFVSVASAPPVKLKRNRGSAIFLMLQVFVIVIMSTGLAVAYFGFIASDRFVSATQIVIQSNEGQSPLGLQSLMGSGAASLMGGGSSGSQGDIVATYIHSTSIVRELQELLSLREMYGPDNVDRLSRLDPSASREDFLEYYRSRTNVQWDSQTNLLLVEVQAFTPSDAKLILDTIIMLSEEKLNSLTERKQQDLVAFAKVELVRAEQRLSSARLAVADFRQKYGEIDPVSSAESAGGLLAGINAQLAAEKAQLGSMLFVMKADSPQVRGVRARIKSLEKQAIEEKKRLTGNSGIVLSTLVSEYEGLIIEEEFARATYTSALSFLESTRARAQQESSYVVDFVTANLPDEATKPDRYIIILTVFVVSLLVLGISRLIVAAIKEQAKI